jgi:hypothetical protein
LAKILKVPTDLKLYRCLLEPQGAQLTTNTKPQGAQLKTNTEPQIQITG